MTERMDILVARQYESNGETRTALTRIGTAWAMKERDGYSLTFEALPLPSLNDKGQIETRVLMMPPKPKEDQQQPRQQSGGSYSNDKGARRIQNTPAFESGGMDDDIPF